MNITKLIFALGLFMFITSTSLAQINVLNKKFMTVTGESIEVSSFYSSSVKAESPVAKIVTNPAHGTVINNGYSFANMPNGPTSYINIPLFTYTPAPNFVGLDSFTYTISIGSLVSNTAKITIMVRPAHNDFHNQTVNIIVNDLLLAEMTPEVNRLKADLQADGYTVKIKSWPSAPDPAGTSYALWQYLQSEYQNDSQFLVGALFIGAIPYARTGNGDNFGQGAGSVTDVIYMGLEQWGYTSSSNNIWVGRISASNLFFGDEVTQTRRALQSNHDYRTGVSRRPHTSFYYDDVGGTNFSSLLLNLWPTSQVLSPLQTWALGGEYMGETSHGSYEGYNGGAVNTWSIHDLGTQIRFAFNGSCQSGTPGGVVNQQIFTRGSANVLSLGASENTWTGMFNLFAGSTAVSMLERGDSMGNAIIADYMAVRDYTRALFYGDPSLSIKKAPPNEIPIFSNLSANSVIGKAPFQVKFTAIASDPDGSIANYEWFTVGHYFGKLNPALSGPSSTVSYTYDLPHNYMARAVAVDNYKARVYREIEINVLPQPGQSIRIAAGRMGQKGDASSWSKSNPFGRPDLDFMDSKGHIWLHDQGVRNGNWGFTTPDYSSQYSCDNCNLTISGTNDPEIFKTFRFDHPVGTGIKYDIPMANGTYTVNLGFADFQNKTAGQRLIDIFIQGMKVSNAFDIVAEAGPNVAKIKSFSAQVTDGHMYLQIVTNPSSPQAQGGSYGEAIINNIEIIPGAELNPNPDNMVPSILVDSIDMSLNEEVKK